MYTRYCIGRIVHLIQVACETPPFLYWRRNFENTSYIRRES